MPIIGNNVIEPLNVFRPRRSYAHRLATRFHTAAPNEAVLEFQIHAAAAAPDGTQMTCALYTVSGGLPNVKVGTNVGVFIATQTLQWWTSDPVSINLTAGVTYTIAMDGVAIWRYANVSMASSRNIFIELPDPWAETSASVNDMSFFAQVGEPTGDILKYPCCAQRPI